MIRACVRLSSRVLFPLGAFLILTSFLLLHTSRNAYYPPPLRKTVPPSTSSRLATKMTSFSHPPTMAEEWNGSQDLLSLMEATVNPHEFKFTIREDSLCAARDNVFVLTVVHTAPGNYKRRMLIRETWGNPKYYQVVRTVVLFAMGLPQDEKVQNSIKLESEKFHDIIQEDFLDSYRNLTYKSIMWLQWAGIFCPNARYTVKVDDDIIVNIFNLAKHLNELYVREIASNRSIICLVWNGMKVMRDPKSKWYIPKEDYPNDKFSTYCSGSAYILSQDLLYPMFQNSFKHKFFWVDDFYTTGLLPRGLNVVYHSINSLYVLKSAQTDQQKGFLENFALFGHVGSLRLRYKLWLAILKHKGVT